MIRGAWLTNILWLLPALILLVLIVGAMVFFWDLPYDGCTWDFTGRIHQVDPGGPAERAGLRVGDVILAVAGRPPGDWEYLSRAYWPDDMIAVTFRRGEQVSTTAVTVESPPLNERAVPLLILVVALAFCLVSLIVLLSRPGAAETRLFYAMSQVGAAALATGLFSMEVSIAARLYGGLLSLLTPLMVHFHAIFPERRWLVERRGLLVLIYGVGLVLGVWRWISPQGTVWHLWLLLGFVAAIGLMVIAYATTASSVARQRIRLVVLGTVLGFGPVALLTVAPMVWSDPVMGVPPEYTIPLMSAIPAAYAVALWRYNLMGVDRALNRGLVYLLVSTVLFGAYLIALALFHTLWPMDMVGRAALGAAAALLAAVTFRPLRDGVQRVVDRLFYGGWYDYRGLVEEVGSALACTLDQEMLAEVLVKRVPQAMHLPGATLLLERNERLEVVRALGMDSAEALAAQGGLAAEQSGVRLDAERAIVPLVVEGQGVGVWVLAARPGEGWGAEDEHILTALGHQAALAAQNVRLIAALRAKVAEVEEMHRRLLAVREEERAELARELHDGVIQDLVGLRYRLESLQEGNGDPERVGEVHAQVGQLIDELRRLCSDLRPPALDSLGLAAALRTLTREMTARGLPVEAHLEDVSLPNEAAIGLYRIGQEALVNVWRHAGASCAAISLMRDGDEVVLTVADDGRGFDPATAWGQAGRFGLRGMAERAEALGGHLVVESAPDAGTRVTARLPACGREEERDRHAPRRTPWYENTNPARV